MRQGGALFFALVALLSCASSGQPAESSVEDTGATDQEFVELTYLVVDNMTHLAAFVALDLGLWAERGLDIELRVLGSGAEIGAALAAGQADLGAVNGGTGVAPLRAAGLNVKLVAPYNSDGGNARYVDWIGMVGRVDRGITDQPESIIGKRVAVTAGGTARAFLTEWLRINGLTENDIEILPMEPPEMVNAVLSGDADLVIPSDPYRSSALRQLGDNGIEVAAGESLVLSAVGLGALDGRMEEQPEVFRAVIEGLVEALFIIRSDPERAAPAVLNFADGVMAEDAVAAMDRNSYDPRVSLCIRYGVETTAAQLQVSGRLDVDEPFTADDLLDSSLLDQVLADHPEWIADLPPLPTRIEDCEGIE